MWFRQIFGGSTPPKYFTDGVPLNICGVYTPQKIHGWGSVKYLGGLQPQNISRMGFRQIFAGSTPPKYSTDGVPSNIWGVYTPQIFDGWGSVKYYDGVPSNIWGVYSPQIFHGWGSVKYLGGLQPQNISRMGFRQIFAGSTPPKYFTDGVPSNIWGVYTPQIFDGWGSVKYYDGVPSNIWGVYSTQIFHRWGSVKYLGVLHPQNISRMGFR